MYLDFFGLSKPPYRITPDTHVFFEGSDRGTALQALCYATTQGEGITKVIGEVGTGKTMLCRMLSLNLQESVDWVYLAHPSLSAEHTLHAIAHEMGLQPEDKDDKLRVMRQLHAALLARHAKGRRVVVLVEEAQGMSLETLEEIRLLSNLETDENKLLQIILFGQPELDEKLANPVIRQLRERITYSLYLAPMAAPDIQIYLNFRLRAAGYKGPDLFNKKLACHIATYSQGLIRRINIIADKALLTAFTHNRHTITLEDVRVAAHDSHFNHHKHWWQLWSFASTIFLAFAITGKSQLLDSAPDVVLKEESSL